MTAGTGRRDRGHRPPAPENAAGLQSALRAAGIPIQVAFQVSQPSDSPPLPADCKNVTMSDEANADLQGKILGMPDAASGGREGIALTIYPRQIPKGIGIYLAIQSGSNSRDWGWGLDLVQATPRLHRLACCGRRPCSASASGAGGGRWRPPPLPSPPRRRRGRSRATPTRPGSATAA